MRYISLDFDSIWFQVMFHIFISFQRFSLALLLFNDIWGICQILTHSDIYVCISIYYDGWRSYEQPQVYVCAGKLRVSVCVWVWLDLCYSHFSHTRPHLNKPIAYVYNTEIVSLKLSLLSSVWFVMMSGGRKLKRASKSVTEKECWSECHNKDK